MKETMGQMPALVYVDEANTPWVHRWLHSQSNRQVTFLVEPAALPVAQALATQYPHVQNVVSITDPGELGSHELHLPCAVPTYRFDLFPQERCPDLDSLLPLLQNFHSLGIEHFHFHGPTGEFSIQIPSLLHEFKNRHEGQRCFIVGNGPSLNDIDMTLLKDEITFGSNRCYLGYENWGFPFTYWGIADEYQAHSHAHEYAQHIPAHTEKFCPLRYLPLLDMPKLTPVQIAPVAGQRHFSATEPLGAGHSVTHMLLQLAAAMGCNPIILVGVDHNYELHESKTSQLTRDLRESIMRPLRNTFLYHAIRTWREAKGKDSPMIPQSGPGLWDATLAKGNTHFSDAYTQEGEHKFALPQTRESEKDYDHANTVTRNQGIKILNATPGSQLNSFENVSFDSLFS